MSKRIDLVGQVFSHLTVLKLDEEKTQKNKKTYWIVECDCCFHTKFSVLASNLKSGNTTKCKYCKAENLIGQKFNRLTVTEKIIDKHGHIKWKAKCECGNEIEVRSGELKSEHTKSCGCLQKEFVSQLNSINLIGQKFGKLTVVQESLRRDSSGSKYWFCNCDCGTLYHEVSGHHLKLGNIISCGCSRSKGEKKLLIF